MMDKPKEKRKRKNGEPRFRLRRLAYQIVGLMVVLTLATIILGNAITPDSYRRILDGMCILSLIFVAAAGVLMIASVRAWIRRLPIDYEERSEVGMIGRWIGCIRSLACREWLEVGLICLLVAVTFLITLMAMGPAIGMIFSNIFPLPRH